MRWKLMNNDYYLDVVDINNKKAMQEVSDFLKKFDLELDFIDYCITLRNVQTNEIMATCSTQFNLIKCIAVCSKFGGLGLSNVMVTHMLERISNEGYDEAFIITKEKNRDTFMKMGFGMIYENDTIAFLTNRPDRVTDYENYLKSVNIPGNNGVIVMNANPFTYGHQYLIEQASKQVDTLYVVPVLENMSFFTYDERKEMITKGSEQFKNVKVLNGCPYIISKSVFPSYFLKSDDEVIKQQTNLDANIFVKLFKEPLDVKKRFVGTEPYSKTTEMYNEALATVMNANGIELVVIDRKDFDGKPISASTARLDILNHNEKELEEIVPKTTLQVLNSIDLDTRLKTDKTKIFKDN
ncbi:adenylyltransferase/cytidyltransferase family protein [Mesoplasma lactucae]|nr:adenylyltransferase/cytidyltransferase family protein [Mesoplasma lactucae]